MKDMKWLKENYIAHRGLHAKTMPENSMEAFLNATDQGFDIEFDLQLSKDNEIVIIHDDNLSRLCGVDEKVHNLNYSELKKLKLKNTNSSIPLFTELLEAIPQSTNLMIELKTGKKNKQLVSLFLDTIKNYDFTYSVQSFDPRIVRMLRRKAPQITRGYILKDRQTNCNFINTMAKVLPIHSWAKPDYYVYKFEDLPNKKMDSHMAKGTPILSYTVQSPQEMKFIKERYHNAVFESYIPNQK